MAKSKMMKAPVVPDSERVDLIVPYTDKKDEPNLLISINGVNYLIPKGEIVRVPKFVRDEYLRSQRAFGIQSEKATALMNQAQQPK